MKQLPTKKQNQQRSTMASSPRKMVAQRGLVVIAILLIVILAAFLYRFAAVGKAVGTPQPQPIDLDLTASEIIHVKQVPQLLVKVTPSKKSSPLEYSLQLQVVDEDTVSYALKEKGTVVAQELLTEGFGTMLIYLPGDDEPDLEVQYLAPYLKILNKNYQAPAPVKIEIFDANKLKYGQPYLFAHVGNTTTFFFNITSSAAVSPDLPSFTAMWGNGTVLSSPEFSENASGTVDGTVFRTMLLTWTPAQEGLYVFFIDPAADPTTADRKRYVLAVGGIVYESTGENVPNIKIKQDLMKGGIATVTYRFKETGEDQPFSLPCGEAELRPEKFPVEKVKALFSFDKTVQQWQNNIPSDFKKLETNKGYYLRRASAKGEMNFSVTCTVKGGILPPNLPAEASPLFVLPVLKKGWNLIGVSGYEPVAVEKLDDKLPPYTSASLIYGITDDGTDLQTSVTELEPGKAYWVMVE